MRRVATVRVAGSYVDIATGLGSVWLADDEGGAIVRVDPSEEAISRTYEVGGSPLGIDIGASAVWVASDDGTVARLDPERADVALIKVGGTPRRVAVGDQVVWVSVD